MRAALDAYLTLDAAAVMAAATADPEGFIAGLTGRTVIDEVQRAPGLAPAIKERLHALPVSALWLL